MCCESPSPPPPPNYAPIGAATERAAQLAYQAADNDLAFRKQVYAESQPRQQQLYDLAQQAARQQMGLADTAAARSTEQYQHYLQNFQPIETQMARESMQAGGLADQQRAAGRAIADMNAQVASQRGQGMRAAAAMGKKYANAPGQDVLMGAMNAAAATNARQSAVDRGMSLRAGAAAFGRNMPNTAGQNIGLSGQLGSSAVGNQNTGFMSGLPYAQFAAGGYGTQLGAAGLAQQGALGMGGLMSRDYGTQAGIYSNQLNQPSTAGALLGAAGTVAGAYMGSPSGGAAVTKLLGLG